MFIDRRPHDRAPLPGGAGSPALNASAASAVPLANRSGVSPSRDLFLVEISRNLSFILRMQLSVHYPLEFAGSRRKALDPGRPAMCVLIVSDFPRVPNGRLRRA